MTHQRLNVRNDFGKKNKNATLGTLDFRLCIQISYIEYVLCKQMLYIAFDPQKC